MYIKEELPNGVRVVTEEIKHVRSVSIGLWIGVGSRDETPQNSGIAHLVEHMMFKGTKKRTAKQIAEELDAVGGQLNAFTSKEYTCYYAKTLDEHFPVAVDLLSDMFFNSLIDKGELEKEKNVVLEEINMYEDAPDELIHDLLSKTVWGDHPLGRPVIGTKEVVEKITREDIIKFMQENYTSDRLVIAVAGNISHKDVMRLVNQLFGNMEKRKGKRSFITPVANYSTANRKKETEQVHLCLGTAGLPMDDEGIYVMHIMNGILGGGLSSRLFQKIREDRGLAYAVFSYHSSYKDAGLFTIYTGLSGKNLESVIQLITEELKDFKHGKLSEDEVTRAKEQLKGNLFLGLENVSNRMSRLGKSELCLNKIVTPEEAVKQIDEVKIDHVKELANQLFDSEKMSLALIGPKNYNIEISL